MKQDSHDRAYTRKMNWRKAVRKRQIVRHYGYDYYDNLHQYSKNKIHCSCPMCRRQGIKVSDRRKLEDVREQIEETENIDESIF